MYILNIASTLKKMPANEIRDLIFENYHQRTEFFNKNSYYSMKRLKKKKIFCCLQKN